MMYMPMRYKNPFQVESSLVVSLSLFKRIVEPCTVMSRAGSILHDKSSAEFKRSEFVTLLQALEPR